MDWSLLIFIFVVLFFAYRGYKRGLLKSVSRVASLVAGYVAVLLYTEQVSTILESQSQLHGIVSYVSAALILFFGAAIGVSFLFWLVEKLLPTSEDTSVASSLGGATVGLVIGVIAAIVIVWTFAFVRDMRPKEDLDAVANIKESRIEHLASRVASKAVNIALSMSSAKPEVINLGTALIAAPAEIAQHAQRLTASNDLNRLLGDPKNQAVLNRGDIGAVKKLPAFRQLAKNPDMLALAKSAGMLGESADNTQAGETALARQITNIWKRTQRVKNNKRAQEILSDPEFQQKVQSGNPIDLLTNVRLLELADIIFADNAAPANTKNNSSNSVQPNDSLQQISEEEIKIFSWVDENGRIHYSDIKDKP